MSEIVFERGDLRDQYRRYDSNANIAEVTLDILQNIKRIGNDGHITNDHDTHELYVQISNNGIDYGGLITVYPHETLPLTGLCIAAIKLNASANTTPYRVVIY